MGWAYGVVNGREVGYAVPAVCDEPGCEARINHGLSYLCGEMHGQDDDACGGYFCEGHLFYTGHGQRCGSCESEPCVRPVEEREGT